MDKRHVLLVLISASVLGWYFLGNVYINTDCSSTSPRGDFIQDYLKEPDINSSQVTKKVALGMGITFRKLDTVKRFRNASSNAFNFYLTPFFVDYLPSFCKTVSVGYEYTFYIAHDYNDPLLKTRQGRDDFTLQMWKDLDKCRKNGVTVGIRLINLPYSGHPAWAQNDAMIEAYHDDNDYFYMANDDTKFVTGNWTNKFAEALAKFKPPNVGTVGPAHRGGAMGIMTYNFVHRTHFSIFHYFYPRDFKDWYADNWMTNVYPKNNTLKVKSVQVHHLMSIGRRYELAKSMQQGSKAMQGVLKFTRPMVLTFIKHVAPHSSNKLWYFQTKKKEVHTTPRSNTSSSQMNASEYLYGKNEFKVTERNTMKKHIVVNNTNASYVHV